MNRFGDFYGENDDREAEEPGDEVESWRQEFLARLDDPKASVYELLEELALFEERDPAVEASEREELLHAAGEIVRCLQPHFVSLRLLLGERSDVVLTADQCAVPSHYRSWLKQHMELHVPQSNPQHLQPEHIDAEALDEVRSRAFAYAKPGRSVVLTVEATKNRYGTVAGFRIQLHYPSSSAQAHETEILARTKADGTFGSVHTRSSND